jgi:hypothetical protein
MMSFLLITGLIACCLLGPLYTLKGKKDMATKKTVKPAPAVKRPGEVVTEYGTFQVSDRGVIVQTKFPTDVASHTGTMNAEQVSADIRSRV